MTFKKITVGLFFTIIIVVAMATMLLPKRSFSELENRDLQEAPKLTIASLMDKTYMTKAETYLADHMLLRDFMAASKTRMEMLIGKQEINGVFIGKERLLENVLAPDPKITNENIQAINKFAEKYEGRLSTHLMLVPTASEIYKSELPALAEQFDQAKYIKEAYDGLVNAAGVDVYSFLASSSADYIYYRTDHHWTSLGSYIGYTALAKPLGFKAAAIDSFNVEHASHDFLGTLYSKVLYGEKLKDNIDLYHFAKETGPIDVIKYTENNTQSYPSVFFKENLEIKDKYTVFLGGNEAVLKIKTGIKNGKKLVIFKDSYAHSLMQFLPLHYEEIALVDLRYLNRPLEEYVKLSQYNQALFLYNVSGFVSDATVKKVSIY